MPNIDFLHTRCITHHNGGHGLMVMAIILLIAVCTLGWLMSRSTQESIPPIVPVLPERFVIFDLETTGLDPSKHEIIEIGAIRVNRDSKSHDTLETLVKPQNIIPKRITSLTGISQEMVENNGASLADALEQFRAFIGDLPLVAFNADFDQSFLYAACSSVRSDTFRNEVYCALKLARRAWPGRRSYKLSELARDGGLVLDGEHRALGDCKRTMIVYAAAAQSVGSYR